MKSVIVSWIFPIAFLIVVLGYVFGVFLFSRGLFALLAQDSQINPVADMCSGIGLVIICGRLIDVGVKVIRNE